jgi:hypothetical protein
VFNEIPKPLALAQTHFEPLENKSQTLILRRRTYVVVCSADVRGGPSDVRSTKSITDIRETTRRTLLFGVPFR